MSALYLIDIDISSAVPPARANLSSLIYLSLSECSLQVEFVAVSLVQNVIEGFVYGIMLGMGSALETLSGQAVGAGRFDMLGIYLQRSFIVTGTTALCLMPFYIFATPFLKLLSQEKEISELAGKTSSLCNFWIFPRCMDWLSLRAFKSLASFVKLSFASAVMLSLELWYYTAVILMVGWLNNPEIAVDAVSICMNLQQWTLMISLGFHTEISVRVSNELGPRHPKAAKFSIVVSVITSAAFGILFTVLILAFENQFPKLFTDKPILIRETSKLAYFLAATIFLNSIQAVLLGVAVGAGWQFLVALISIACYYFFGLPVGALLGYGFKLGINGIWSGLLLGCLFQTTVLVIRMLQTNWQKEALEAEDRLKTMEGPPDPQLLE
ncbi:hypothetical protein WN944_028972 [Citrus x changshan-huyou]|uniref:Multidrug and toxic compound extrusion protein n=1 Tax=Citrus x changshan-huyou TaxID=2935761 RepID=A0AAP0LLI7_9ROSI